MMLQSRFVVVREAIAVVLRHLGCLPPSDRTAQLHAGLDDCLQEVERWSASPPTDRDGETVMKRVLALHVKVTKLERAALLAVVKGSFVRVNDSAE
jgi:hypothetical protein